MRLEHFSALSLVATCLWIEASSSQIITQPKEPQPNELRSIDLRLVDNLSRHRTEGYRQARAFKNVSPYQQGPFRPSVVLRRGELLDLVLHFCRPFNSTEDRCRLEFSFGSQPQLADQTLVYVHVGENVTSFTNSSNWEARLLTQDKATNLTLGNLKLQVNLPSDLPIGIWRLRVSTRITGSRIIRTFSVNEDLYILFNAWNPSDDVYLTQEPARQEYVLNEVGKIYIGSYQRPTGRKWTYGQFHETVLPTLIYMLDHYKLTVAQRSDVVRMSRAISALVNVNDDNGLLVGNWSGSYGNGLAPWQWTGSAAIFDRYARQGFQPVRFGQCWVFGGVLTTALRTLGIPARTISNFVSAHDTDLSLTVDEFYSEWGEKITGINTDSIWNFHVWSEAWMARYDLPPGYSGWQAVDATPQETSMEKYQLGPASLEAVKQGQVGFAYDVGFVFSEVNADVVRWRTDSRVLYRWRKTSIQTDHVGRKMLTKAIGVLDERSTYGTNDAEDIVSLYKYPEGSQEERNAYKQAAKYGGLEPILDHLTGIGRQRRKRRR